MKPESPDLEEVRRIVCTGLQGFKTRIFLFGSWAAGNAARVSDIDVAVLPLESIPGDVLARIREDLEESRVIYPVDLVNLSETSEEFRFRVIREGIPWNE